MLSVPCLFLVSPTSTTQQTSGSGQATLNHGGPRPPWNHHDWFRFLRIYLPLRRDKVNVPEGRRTASIKAVGVIDGIGVGWASPGLGQEEDSAWRTLCEPSTLVSVPVHHRVGDQ